MNAAMSRQRTEVVPNHRHASPPPPPYQQLARPNPEPVHPPPSYDAIRRNSFAEVVGLQGNPMQARASALRSSSSHPREKRSSWIGSTPYAVIVIIIATMIVCWIVFPHVEDYRSPKVGKLERELNSFRKREEAWRRERVANLECMKRCKREREELEAARRGEGGLFEGKGIHWQCMLPGPVQQIIESVFDWRAEGCQ